MDSSLYIAIRKEVINVVVAIEMQMTKSINRCANTEAYKVVEGVCESEILKSQCCHIPT
jgi:hypothetical protein